MFRLLFRLLGNGKKLPILIYHQVLPANDFMRTFEPNAEEFERQMSLISRYLQPIPLTEAINDLSHATLPKGAICVTFDDGYENNASVALPILKKYGIPATFFIASDFLNGGIMWNDQVLETFRRLKLGQHNLNHLGLGDFTISNDADRLIAASEVLKQLKHLPFDERADRVSELSNGMKMPTNLMMTNEQVRLLSDAGMEIGGHTLSHPILTKVSPEEADRQIRENKRILEEITGKEITSFAYPNGKPNQDYDHDICAVVKNAGYTIALSTSPGVAKQNSVKCFEIPRYTPWRRNKLGFLSQLASNYFTKATFTY